MTLTGIIIFLLVGAIAGWLAGLITKGGGFGLIGDIVVGIIGSLIGGWLFGLLGIAAGGLIGSIIAAVVGAIILIAIVRLIKAVGTATCWGNVVVGSRYPIYCDPRAGSRHRNSCDEKRW